MCSSGTPPCVVQGYLIVTSVVTAYVFTNIPAWTTWCLLIAMALYDLYAVLTPGGPLKVAPAGFGGLPCRCLRAASCPACLLLVRCLSRPAAAGCAVLPAPSDGPGRT